jgi:hypothetical protein
MLWPYAGYDAGERPISPRGPASRFSDEEIEAMVELAQSGASSIEIGHQLGIKAESVRARLWRSGIRLRKRVARLRVRLVVPITKRIAAAADQRGISVPALIRRLLAAISKNDLFDELLPIPQPRSLGAAATPCWHNQPPTILRRIELGGCIETPRLAICLAQPAV